MGLSLPLMQEQGRRAKWLSGSVWLIEPMILPVGYCGSLSIIT